MDSDNVDGIFEADKLWCFDSNFSFEALEAASDGPHPNYAYAGDTSAVVGDSMRTQQADAGLVSEDNLRYRHLLDGPVSGCVSEPDPEVPIASCLKPSFLDSSVFSSDWLPEGSLEPATSTTQHIQATPVINQNLQNFVYQGQTSLSCDGQLLSDFLLEHQASKTSPATQVHPVLEEFGLPTNNSWWSTERNATDEPVTSQPSTSANTESVDPKRLLKFQLDHLTQDIACLRHQLDLQLYTHDVNRSKLTYWSREYQICDQYFESQRYSSKPLQFMSLLADDNGRPPPSTPEAIQKADEKQQLPMYRKKYDWNLQLWSDQDRKRLFKLTASQIATDIVKLKVEAKLYSGDIEKKNIAQHLLEERSSLGLDQPVPKETMIHTMDLLRAQLHQKAERMAPHLFGERTYLAGTDLLTIEFDDGSSLLSLSSKDVALAALPSEDCSTLSVSQKDQETVRQSWYTQVQEAYWKQFWDNVALMMGSRFEWSGRDCQIQWNHHVSPEVNLRSFTQEEDELLCRLVCVYRGRDWDSLAKEMGTGRTAYQCFERYQRHFNKSLLNGDWSHEEDMELMAAVEDMGHELSGPSRWSRVALRLPGRSNLQCRSRYLYTLKANLKQGHWSPSEDILLQLLVYAYGGGRWSKIARHMPGRTDMKCRERYEGVLKPALEDFYERQGNTEASSTMTNEKTAFHEAALPCDEDDSMDHKDPVGSALTLLFRKILFCLSSSGTTEVEKDPVMRLLHTFHEQCWIPRERPPRKPGSVASGPDHDTHEYGYGVTPSPSQVWLIDNIRQEVQESAHDAQSSPQECSSFPREVQSYPSEAPSFPHDAPSFPHDAPSFPHDAPSFPHDAPSFPHGGLPFPHEAPSFPRDAPSFLHGALSFPHEAPSFPDGAPSFPHEALSPPQEDPSFPDKVLSSSQEALSFPQEASSFPQEAPSFPKETVSPSQQASYATTLPSNQETSLSELPSRPTMSLQSNPSSLLPTHINIYVKCKYIATLHLCLTKMVGHLVPESHRELVDPIVSQIIRLKEQTFHLSKDFFRTVSLTDDERQRVDATLTSLFARMENKSAENYCDHYNSNN